MLILPIILVWEWVQAWSMAAITLIRAKYLLHMLKIFSPLKVAHQVKGCSTLQTIEINRIQQMQLWITTTSKTKTWRAPSTSLQIKQDSKSLAGKMRWERARTRANSYFWRRGKLKIWTTIPRLLNIRSRRVLIIAQQAKYRTSTVLKCTNLITQSLKHPGYQHRRQEETFIRRSWALGDWTKS